VNSTVNTDVSDPLKKPSDMPSLTESLYAVTLCSQEVMILSVSSPIEINETAQKTANTAG